MQYLASGLTLIIAHGIIWITAAFWPTSVYFCLTQIMAPPLVFANLVKWKIHLFRCPTYGLLVGAIVVKCPRPHFNNGPGITRIVAAFWPPAFIYSSLTRLMASRQAIPILERGLKIATACTIAALLISRFFPPKCSEASFKRAQSV